LVFLKLESLKFSSRGSAPHPAGARRPRPGNPSLDAPPRHPGPPVTTPGDPYSARTEPRGPAWHDTRHGVTMWTRMRVQEQISQHGSTDTHGRASMAVPVNCQRLCAHTRKPSHIRKPDTMKVRIDGPAQSKETRACCELAKQWRCSVVVVLTLLYERFEPHNLSRVRHIHRL